jgi:hypothetical protein
MNRAPSNLRLFFSLSLRLALALALALDRDWRYLGADCHFTMIVCFMGR